jgi:glutamate dehydrogenase/leucine dehydrogenase
VPSCFCDVITPAPTEGRIDARDFPNISAAAAIEYDNEDAQFQ